MNALSHLKRDLAWTIDNYRYQKALEYVSTILDILPAPKAQISAIPAEKPPYFTLKVSTCDGEEELYSETTLSLLELHTEDRDIVSQLQDVVNSLQERLRVQLSHCFAMTMQFEPPTRKEATHR